MKALKISLSVIVAAAISFFVIRSLVKTPDIVDIPPTDNPFVNKIQLEIKELKAKSENSFCNQYYNTVAYHIDDYYKNNRLGQNKLKNNQWKEILTKQLYASYTDKFIKQAYYVFNHSSWTSNDLSFILNEYQLLQKDPLLERNSPIDQKFNEIKLIFIKYDEIEGFISSCKGFSFSDTRLNNPFPIQNVRTKIDAANFYRNNGLGNSYVNNCSRLHDELKGIPQILFRNHVRYLDNLINSWSNQFKDYNTQSAYVSGIYTPISNKIDELDYDIYKVSEFNQEYKRLKTKWESDGTRAYNHFNQN